MTDMENDSPKVEHQTSDGSPSAPPPSYDSHAAVSHTVPISVHRSRGYLGYGAVPSYYPDEEIWQEDDIATHHGTSAMIIWLFIFGIFFPIPCWFLGSMWLFEPNDSSRFWARMCFIGLVTYTFLASIIGVAVVASS